MKLSAAKCIRTHFHLCCLCPPVFWIWNETMIMGSKCRPSALMWGCLQPQQCHEFPSHEESSCTRSLNTPQDLCWYSLKTGRPEKKMTSHAAVQRVHWWNSNDPGVNKQHRLGQGQRSSNRSVDDWRKILKDIHIQNQRQSWDKDRDNHVPLAGVW